MYFLLVLSLLASVVAGFGAIRANLHLRRERARHAKELTLRQTSIDSWRTVSEKMEAALEQRLESIRAFRENEHNLRREIEEAAQERERVTNERKNVEHDLAIARKMIDTNAREIARLTIEHDNMKRRKDEREKDVTRLESQLMHALATMDSVVKNHTKDSEATKLAQSAVERVRELSDVVRRALDSFNQVEGDFKRTADSLFIDVAENRQTAAGLLETIKETSGQLVTLAQEFAGLRRAGFQPRGDLTFSPVAGGETKYRTTDEADADAVRQQRAEARRITVDAVDSE